MKLHDNDIAAMQQLQQEHDRLLERWKDAPAYSQDVANLHTMFKAWDGRVGKLVAEGLFKRILEAATSGVPLPVKESGDSSIPSSVSGEER